MFLVPICVLCVSAWERGWKGARTGAGAGGAKRRLAWRGKNLWISEGRGAGVGPHSQGSPCLPTPSHLSSLRWGSGEEFKRKAWQGWGGVGCRQTLEGERVGPRSQSHCGSRHICVGRGQAPNYASTQLCPPRVPSKTIRDQPRPRHPPSRRQKGWRRGQSPPVGP